MHSGWEGSLESEYNLSVLGAGAQEMWAFLLGGITRDDPMRGVTFLPSRVQARLTLRILLFLASDVKTAVLPF